MRLTSEQTKVERERQERCDRMQADAERAIGAFWAREQQWDDEQLTVAVGVAS